MAYFDLFGRNSRHFSGFEAGRENIENVGEGDRLLYFISSG